MLTINAGEPSASDSLEIRGTGNAGSLLLLNDSEVEATAQAAWDRWFGPRWGHGQRGEFLKGVTFEIVDLPGQMLALATSETIYVDLNAAGFGWFADVDGSDDALFDIAVGDGRIAASPGSEAYGRMDLLTVLGHEMGHLLGFDHSDDSALMAPTLEAGMRVIAGPEQVLGSASETCRPALSGGVNTWPTRIQRNTVTPYGSNCASLVTTLRSCNLATAMMNRSHGSWWMGGSWAAVTHAFNSSGRTVNP